MKTLIFFSTLFLINVINAQQTKYVDFKRAAIEIYSINTVDEEIAGQVAYYFDVLKDIDSIYLDAKDFLNVSIILNDQKSNNFVYDGKRIVVKEKFEANSSHVLYLNWLVQPKKALYFVRKNGNEVDQIWTQGQGKYTSHWMPSIDDMNEKIEFDLTITFDSKYEVVANGQLIKKEVSKEKTRWYFDMKAPMSSYLVAFVIGEYNKKTYFSTNGIPLEMYFYPEDSLKYEPTYRYTKQIFDFLEDEIGIAYPWQNYKQIPVHGFMYAGMENTSTTIFSDTYVVDSISFVDINYVNINAHELAHQWFGDLITETSNKHHWLQEGFATYYALLAEKKAFGEDYFYWKLHESAQQLYVQDLTGKGTSLLDPKSSSLTFYQKGAWTLYMLQEKVGEVVFKEAVKNYLNKYEFKNVSTGDFIDEVELTSEQDLSGFVEVWLHNKEFPFDRALDALKHNSMFIQEYLMVDCEVKSSKCKDYLNSSISDEAKSKLIAQAPTNITSEVFESSIKVRQAIAINLKEIPSELKADYETLLDDRSYLTIENALFNLWNNFPKERIKYLTKTKAIQGLNNKNVRLLWLLLASLTPEYDSVSTNGFVKELNDYTSSRYNFELRITAFQYLDMIKSCEAQCRRNLAEAKDHYNWQLAKFAKSMLEKMN